MIPEGYFFLFVIEIICNDPSSEPSRDGSDEGSQHMFNNIELTKISLIITKYSLLSRDVGRTAGLLSNNGTTTKLDDDDDDFAFKNSYMF